MKTDTPYSAWKIAMCLLCLFSVLLLCAQLSATLTRGDFTRNGWVDLDDLLILAEHWLDLGPVGCPSDPSDECRLTLADFAVLSEYWQTLYCSPFNAVASSHENPALSAENAVDGTLATRWSSSFSDNQWLLLDMGQIRTVAGLQIFWETAYASRYSIETSIDQNHWTQVYEENNGTGDLDDISFSPVTAQYIRINCIERATQWGSSIYQVFVKTDDDCLAAGQWQLIWSDEFTDQTINPDNWTFEIGTRGDGWGNWEWQYYTNRSENARIEDNKLVIEARRENYAGRNYTSARLKTQAKQAFQYGRIEARIQMPTGGHGIWPAFWMLGENFATDGWPDCGEIDIIEMMSDSSDDNRTVIAAIHYAGNDGNHTYRTGSRTLSSPLSEQFRLYAIEWDSAGIRWYVDDINYYQRTWWNSSVGPFPAPFNRPFFIILNFAVGSWWWQQHITEAEVSFPQTMVVDYVRVYRKND